jgi:hypothetical protein
MDRRYVFRFTDGSYYNTYCFYERPTYNLYEAWVSRYKTDRWIAWEASGKGSIIDVNVTIELAENNE